MRHTHGTLCEICGLPTIESPCPVHTSQHERQPAREIQASTFQLPIGDFSAVDALKNRELTAAATAVNIYLNCHSNFESGRTHALSYNRMAEDLGMSRQHVQSAIKESVEKGYLEKNIRGGNKPNTYRIIHHKCEPIEAPQDKDGMPKKCAVPRGQGSPIQMMIEGKISWKAMLYWTIKKIVSDWTTGTVEFTYRLAREWTALGNQTILDIRKQLMEVGLLTLLTKKFQAAIFQLFPKPYEKRRKRRRENPKMMRCDGDFYYSFNERWRVSREDGQIQTLIEGTSRWRYVNEFECNDVNPKIYRDFKPIIELATSPQMRALRVQAA